MLGFSPLASAPPASPGRVDFATTAAAPTPWTWQGGAIVLRSDFVIAAGTPSPWTWQGGVTALAILYHQDIAITVPAANWSWSTAGPISLTINSLPQPRGPYQGKLIKTPVFARGFGVRYQ